VDDAYDFFLARLLRNGHLEMLHSDRNSVDLSGYMTSIHVPSSSSSLLASHPLCRPYVDVSVRSVELQSSLMAKKDILLLTFLFVIAFLGSIWWLWKWRSSFLL
jgi:hypothetical protein